MVQKRFVVPVLGLITLTPSASAQEWLQWRGPTRDGTIRPADVPKEWPASYRRAWRVEIGEGYSSPVVAGGSIYVHSRKDPVEIVTALDMSGMVLWQKRQPAPFGKNSYAAKMAKGPYATPLVAGNRLFTLGATGILTSWNRENGEVLWQKDYSPSIDTSKLFCGTSASPLMEGGSLIVQVGSDVHKGRVLALDPATGNERWAWNGPGPGYSSPIAISAGGLRQIVTMTESSVVGLDAKSGKKLWSIPFPDEWQENIVTPAWSGSHLFVSGVRQGTHAYTLQYDGGSWMAVQAWKNTAASMYMSSPVLAEGVVFGYSNKKRGHFVALDGATGAIRWASEGREGDNASVPLTPLHVVFLTNGSNLIVAKRTAEKFQEVRRYRLSEEETWASPVLLSDGLVLRDATAISLLRPSTRRLEIAGARK